MSVYVNAMDRNVVTLPVIVGEMRVITEDIVIFDQLGEEAMQSIKSMNHRMSYINQNTGSMGVRMHQISKPVRIFPKP